jgi:hypothetical protein
MLSSTSRPRTSIPHPIVVFNNQCGSQNSDVTEAVHRSDVLLLDIDPVQSVENVERLWLSGLPFMDALAEPPIQSDIGEADETLEAAHGASRPVDDAPDHDDEISTHEPYWCEIRRRGIVVSRRRKVKGKMQTSFFLLHGKPGGQKALRRRRDHWRPRRTGNYRRLRRAELRWHVLQFDETPSDQPGPTATGPSNR